MKKSIIISLFCLLFCLSANAKFSFSGVDNIIGVAQENIDTVLVAETTENLLIKYYPGPESHLLNNVLFDIFATEEDLVSHSYVEDFLFVPAIKELEKSCIKK
mgnify:CR=1 FL=1